MKFNYTSEKKKFEKTWKRLEKEYYEAGMSRNQIEEMKQFDWEVFKSERNYRKHNVFISEILLNDEKYRGQELDFLLHKYGNCSKNISEMGKFLRYGWIDELQRRELIAVLEKLSEEDMELVTLVFLEGYTQKEAARIIGLSEKTVWRRLKNVKKKCLNVKKKK